MRNPSSATIAFFGGLAIQPPQPSASSSRPTTTRIFWPSPVQRHQPDARCDAVVVVDDGSTDDPAAVVRRFPGVRLIRQENRGLAAARNAGWRPSTRPMSMFLDADDRLEPRAIDAGARVLRARARLRLRLWRPPATSIATAARSAERFEPPGDAALSAAAPRATSSRCTAR